MPRAEDGIQMEKMWRTPKHLLFSGVSDSDLIQAFVGNRNEMKAEEARATEQNCGRTIEFRQIEKFR